MAAKSQKVIARSQGKTNAMEGSVVQCTAKQGIRLTLRWFPADSTAKLNKQKPLGDSKSLNALSFFIGKQEDGKLQALNPKNTAALKLPSPKKRVGRLEKNRVQFAEASQETRYLELIAFQAKLKGAAPSDEAGKKKIEELRGLNDQGWRDVNCHQIQLSNLPPGITVATCIGRDSKSTFRRYPLWPITTGDNDIVLDIYEAYGQNVLNDTVSEPESQDQGPDGQACTTDYRLAQLSGNIWLRSTHPFTAADVDALSLEHVTPAMKAALKKIYAADFLAQGSDFALDVPKEEGGATKVRLHWPASANENCTHNISGINLRADVPARVHPAAYATAVRAAFDANVTRIDLSSSWRPMLGSMGHRNGLALDMNYLQGEKGLSLNRDGLTNGKQRETISQEEQDAYKNMEEAHKELLAAQKNGDDNRIDAARKADSSAKVMWRRAVEKNQPPMLDSFRKSLLGAKPLVTQVLDPWYLERNNSDDQPPEPNEQKDELEQLHRHHLHITIQDRELES